MGIVLSKRGDVKMQRTAWQETISWALYFIVSLTVVLTLKQFVISPILVDGSSMEPTFADGDIVAIAKLAQVERFDTIVFQHRDFDYLMIKRVVGMPGDTLAMDDDVLVINGKRYDEEYVYREPIMRHDTADFTLQQLTGVEKVPAGHYVVLGDYRLKSRDSRHFGFVTTEEIEGVVKWRLLPKFTVY